MCDFDCTVCSVRQRNDSSRSSSESEQLRKSWKRLKIRGTSRVFRARFGSTICSMCNKTINWETSNSHENIVSPHFQVMPDAATVIQPVHDKQGVNSENSNTSPYNYGTVSSAKDSSLSYAPVPCCNPYKRRGPWSSTKQKQRQ